MLEELLTQTCSNLSLFHSWYSQCSAIVTVWVYIISKGLYGLTASL